MPVLTEAAAVVAGVVAGIEAVNDFNTKQPDGVKVLVATDDGYASVKLKPEIAASIKPTLGMSVGWIVRPGANGGKDRDARTYTSFVRELNPGDLDRLAGFLRQPK